MRVLGIDPGIARSGIAVVEGERGALRLLWAECVETAVGIPDAERLAALFAALSTVVSRHRPSVAAVEQLFFATNRRSAMRVGQARGVTLCVLARAGLGVAEYTPLQVKEAVAGWGAAPKPQVARMVCALLRVDTIPGPDDVADACAVAICHHHRAGMTAKLAKESGGGSAMSPHLRAAVDRAQRSQGQR